jgi:hypothetical protein
MVARLWLQREELAARKTRKKQRTFDTIGRAVVGQTWNDRNNGRCIENCRTGCSMTNKMGVGIASGVGIGVALGVALHNIAIWVAVGVALGVSLGELMNRRNRN